VEPTWSLYAENIFKCKHNSGRVFSLVSKMAKRLTNNVITGSDKRLGLYFYYSPHFGLNIIRKTTSLTGTRVKTDKAFKGFRESGNRMKQASPIAASLYKLIPAEIKQYSMYRLLTGEALNMLKEGLNTELITEKLKRKYIDPLLNEPGVKCMNEETKSSEKTQPEKGLKSFIRFPNQNPHNPGTLTGRIRHRVTQRAYQFAESQTDPEISNLQQSNNHVSLDKYSPVPENSTSPSKTKAQKIPVLIYLGRLPECKSLKIWAYSSKFPV
jgi:hypothetical protein